MAEIIRKLGGTFLNANQLAEASARVTGYVMVVSGWLGLSRPLVFVSNDCICVLSSC